MPTITDDTLAAWTRRSLDAVEDLLRTTLDTPGDPFLTTVATHLLAAGGKRVRPTLVLLAARFGDPDRPEVVRAAAAVELMHVASLYHDDVMDEAATRRGVPSINAKWGNRVAILAGDYLVARAAELAAPLGAAAAEEQARMLTRLVTGQLRETVGAGPDADPERYYMSVIADKTAALFTLATRLGAHAAGAPAGHLEALGAYGEALGIAFQLADDVLDVTQPTARAGKPANADLRQGVATLPVLRALRVRGRGQGRLRNRPARLRRMLAGGPITDAGDLATVTRLLQRSPGLAEARTEVERYADRARRALLPLPASPARDALADMCDQLISRCDPAPPAQPA
ncbi:polyprenyl synthetase family protein [Sphaerisporangium corydalis]|uniref:Polyprenyl synthetase family protein n=1 Tax=Sphaerisporangium corydalis TaxID=1441875 RepID=A0ABV9EAK7_9ACTN|nr:polyprenyl synthetase family protein [Sphaerisporangium corydalis]